MFSFIDSFAQSKLSDKMTFAYTNAEPSIVLSEFSKKIGMNISYQSDLIPKTKISGFYENETGRSILKSILEQNNLTYQILMSDQIVLHKKQNQNTFKEYTLSGRIRDSMSLEYIEGALIVDLLSGTSVYSNEYGFFSIKSKNEVQHLRIIYLGYEEKILKITSDEDSYSEVLLKSNNALPEITIRGNTWSKEKLDGTILSKEDIKVVSAVLGEFDVVRAVQTLPGVSSGADGFGGMHVRGGSYDQNLVLMDDVPMYYSSHAIGLLSMFNADAIRSVKFFKEKIPSNYQSKLSSVLDIHHQDGNLKSWNVDAGIGFLSSKILVDGPLIKDKISILVGARRTNLDPFLKEVTSYFNQKSGKEGSSQYYFYDINAKLGINLSSKDKVYLSYYSGKDFFNDDNIQLVNTITSSSTLRNFQNLSWNNQLLSVRHHRQLFKSLFMKNIVFLSSYNSSLSDINAIKLFTNTNTTDSSLIGKSLNSGIQEIGCSSQFDFQMSQIQLLKFGLSYSNTLFKPTLFSFTEKDLVLNNILEFPKHVNDTVQDLNQSNAQEMAFFIEDKISPNENFSLKIGLRAALLNGKSFQQLFLSPRISFDTYVSEQWALSGAYDRLYQNSHLISTNSLALPSDLWVASSKQLKPQYSNQFSVSLDFIDASKVECKSTLYYKRMNQIVHINDDANFEYNHIEKLEDQFTIGKGQSFGFEFSYRSKFSDKVSQYLNYSFQKSTRQFEALNNGKAFDYKYDRPHQLKVGAQVNINQEFGCGLNFEYSSGNPISLPLGQYPYITIDKDKPKIQILAFEEINNVRLPYILRLDASIFYKIKKSWGFQEFGFGIYNLLNRKNPQFVDIVLDPVNPKKQKYEQVSLMPILPSFSYRIHVTSK